MTAFLVFNSVITIGFLAVNLCILERWSDVIIFFAATACKEVLRNEENFVVSDNASSLVNVIVIKPEAV